MENNNNASSPKLRVLEFYSGIGGMHYALKLAKKEMDFDYEVVEAFDINVNANKVYQLNYQKKVKTVSIENLTPKQIDKYKSNMWLMSPPCQPYTRQGNQKGSTDNRAASFLHLINDILPNCASPPQYVLLENVKGFELSDTHKMLVSQLTVLGYTWQEFLLSPTQFSIPNSRLRFFLLAKRAPLNFLQPEARVRSFIPVTKMYKIGENEDITSLEMIGNLYASSRQIKEFLENSEKEDYFAPFMVPEQLVRRFGKLMDITTPSARRSVCFTKAYGKLCEGTGSVLQLADEAQTADVEDPESWVALKLRYFTPREAANLHGFQEDFMFSNELTHRQSYQLIGNGLNVTVVSELIKYLIKESKSE